MPAIFAAAWEKILLTSKKNCCLECVLEMEKGGVGMGGPGSSWKVLAGPTMLPNTSRGRLAPRVL